MVFQLVHCTSSKTIDVFFRGHVFFRGRDYLTFSQPNKGNAGHCPSLMIIPHRWCDTIDGQNHRWCFNWCIVQVPKRLTFFSRSRFFRGSDYLAFYQPNKGDAGHCPSLMIIPHRWCDTIDGQNHRWYFNWYIVQVPKRLTVFFAVTVFSR